MKELPIISIHLVYNYDAISLVHITVFGDVHPAHIPS